MITDEELKARLVRQMDWDTYVRQWGDLEEMTGNKTLSPHIRHRRAIARVFLILWVTLLAVLPWVIWYFT